MPIGSTSSPQVYNDFLPEGTFPHFREDKFLSPSEKELTLRYLFLYHNEEERACSKGVRMRGP